MTVSVEASGDATTQLTVKSVPVRTREAMNRLAQKRGQTVGRWLAELVDKGERVQAGDMVDPALFDARAVAEEPPSPAPRRPATLTPAELAQLVEVAALTDSAQAKRLAGLLVADYLRLARAAVKAAATPGQDVEQRP